MNERREIILVPIAAMRWGLSQGAVIVLGYVLARAMSGHSSVDPSEVSEALGIKPCEALKALVELNEFGGEIKRGRFSLHPELLASLVALVEASEPKVESSLKYNPSSESPVKEFTRRWHEAYLEVFDERYFHTGGKDGSAAKRLVETSDLSPAQLVEIASQAWQADGKGVFYCKHAASIAGFASKLNEIRLELAKLEPHSERQPRTYEEGVNSDGSLQ